MARNIIRIDSILGGQSPAFHLTPKGGFLSSLGIDPDFPVGASDITTSGVIVPVAYTVFSGANISGYPKWIINNPKNTTTYVYASDGKFVSYNSSFASETLVGTPTSGAGNGALYYNNYIYLMTPTNVSRYGPLNGTPALTNTVWTGATLGSLTALTNTVYPSLRGTPIPNHAGHVHTDGAAYFCDFKNGQGLIHKIKTTKTTDEGDTNDGSAYNVLDLPFGFYPTDIESFGTDLAILAIQTVDTTVNQGNACLFICDTFADTFYAQIPLPDPLATAILNDNGNLLVWSGNASNGVQLSTYIGGYTFAETTFLSEGTPPLAGAVDSASGRVCFGSYTTIPASSASVFALGSKDARLPMGLHNIIKSTSAGANGNVTALKFVAQASSVRPVALVGWGDDSAKGIDKFDSAGTLGAYFWTQVFNMGGKFTVKKIQLPLGRAVASGMTITPKIWVDNKTTSVTGRTINSTNFASSERLITLTDEIQGDNNFFIEFAFTGTVPLPITLPITIEVESEYAFASE